MPFYITSVDTEIKDGGTTYYNLVIASNADDAIRATVDHYRDITNITGSCRVTINVNARTLDNEYPYAPYLTIKNPNLDLEKNSAYPELKITMPTNTKPTPNTNCFIAIAAATVTDPVPYLDDIWLHIAVVCAANNKEAENIIWDNMHRWITGKLNFCITAPINPYANFVELMHITDDLI